jgi:hypothetical protein
MFAGTEAALRVICATNRYISLAGNLWLNRYTSTVKSIAFCQTSKSRCDAILSMVKDHN